MHPIEEEIVSAVVKTALDAGYAISVGAGEVGCYAVTNDRNFGRIMGCLGTMDEDVIWIHTEDKKAHFIQFIYGNEPYYVIADYADREPVRTILDTVQPIVDAHEAAEEERIVQAGREK